MTQQLQRHFVAVWNPSYSEDPMDAHLAVLLTAIRESREQNGPGDDVYVWWAKLRSRNRVQDLPHTGVIEDIGKELDSDVPTAEVNLYLTDYRSLYVGQITHISKEDVRSHDAGRVSNYMKKREVPAGKLGKGEAPPYFFEADYWFKLADIRRLVLDDTVGVVRELALLQNTQYHNRPVSLYGGMVDLPLIVLREDGRTFFSADERDHLSERKWWAELDAERGRGIAQIERDLRDNVLGEEAWAVFDPTARAFLADGERLFREHRRDASFDFSGVVLNFAKAIEVHFRWLIRSALASSPALDSVVTLHEKKRDLRRGEMPALGQLVYLMRKDEAFRRIVAQLTNGEWLISAFSPMVEKLSRIRNDAAHDERVGLKQATEWRNSILGVGERGWMEEFAKVQPRSVRPL